MLAVEYISEVLGDHQLLYGALQSLQTDFCKGKEGFMNPLYGCSLQGK